MEGHLKLQRQYIVLYNFKFQVLDYAILFSEIIFGTMCIVQDGL